MADSRLKVVLIFSQDSDLSTSAPTSNDPTSKNRGNAKSRCPSPTSLSQRLTLHRRTARPEFRETNVLKYECKTVKPALRRRVAAKAQSTEVDQQ